MGQSLVQNYVHIVFSTKDRVALITPPVETELHKYIGGICNELNCPVLIVGGFIDHIHILCMLSKNIALVKLVELLKSHSSKWIKTKGSSFDNFYWQTGYGGFSVSRGHVERVTKYINEMAENYEDPKEVVDFYSNNKQERANIEAVVLEDQVVDYLLAQANVSDKDVSYQDLLASQQQGLM